MKVKWTTAVLLSLCLMVSCAYAESGGDVLESIGGWFSQAWEDTSKWAEQALDDASKWAEEVWKDAPAWIENAWGDASKWIEQAWNKAFPKLTEIWGDVSGWADGVYNSVTETVSAWWPDTFRKVTEAKDKAWGWIQSASEEVRTKITEKYLQLLSEEGKEESDGGKPTEEACRDLLKKLNLSDDDIGKVLETVRVYADQNGISVETLEQIMLPYLVQLAEDASSSQDGQIPAIAVAQYLTGIMVEKGIGTEEDARRMVNILKETLNIR
ncbi:MAG: hypothetical protein IKG23_10035 [Clostridia bacterium]|nr:hypothetical protein [Clostridia bacterium]